ncbi:hypothetical protein OXB_3373 [Bacillus sp. OxB-1]|uniref:DUF3298 and DUF4163 domain-containing protein n=1 Tax=Bacillus sp. (strain OxB-1) TaxID=98228 RepID=UPI0005823081|nr:DUF3298 and DUF4163 domain-containing protein [Bacillus sp. OxB-1]BAQ11842.1 hypothetical protein OXB_3373 [Bacillus sp. OxB-1]
MEFPVSIVTRKLPNVSPKVNVYYPVIVHLENSEVQSKMNHAIIELLNQILIDLDYYDKNLVELLASYEVKTNERGILSLNLIVYSFTGGAHGMTVVRSLTFDTKTGKQYTLKELFKQDSPYVETLSSIIRKQMQRWNVDLLDPPFKEIRPDQDFYLADTSIVIYFQLYEITPYYWGFPYFPIPIKDLETIIQPEGPLDQLMSFT